MLSDSAVRSNDATGVSGLISRYGLSTGNAANGSERIRGFGAVLCVPAFFLLDMFFSVSLIDAREGTLAPLPGASLSRRGAKTVIQRKHFLSWKLLHVEVFPY